jgi:hypothetical protein
MKRLALCLLLGAFGARAAEPPPASWTARVHLLTDEPRVELRRYPDGSLVCHAPCGVDVSIQRGDFFQLRGEGLTSSETFDFAPGAGEVRIKVDPGHSGRRAFGFSFVVFGGVLAAGGLFTDVIMNTDLDGARPSHWGLAVGALGGAFIAGGIAALISGHDTRFEVEHP